MLRPPPARAPEITHALWLASGPGRAWKWDRWAKSIKPGDPLHPLATDVIKHVAEIKKLYRKGTAGYAGKLVERLGAALPKAALVLAEKQLAPYRRGKRKGAVQKSTRIIAALRREHLEEPAKQFWKRLEADERFKRIDDETIVCKADKRWLTLRSFPGLLSKLSLD